MIDRKYFREMLQANLLKSWFVAAFKQIIPSGLQNLIASGLFSHLECMET